MIFKEKFPKGSYEWFAQIKYVKDTRIKRCVNRQNRKEKIIKDTFKFWQSATKRAEQRLKHLHIYKAKKYGLTPEELTELYEQYEYKCAICGKTDGLVIDHNHENGKVRGILCGNCNTMIGFANDNPNVLEQAIKYLTCPL